MNISSHEHRFIILMSKNEQKLASKTRRLKEKIILYSFVPWWLYNFLYMNRRTAKESKESILEAAIKVFSEKGYSQTTIREVAKRAGISVGGVYIYFKNKEEIYFTLLKYLLDEFRDRSGESIEDIIKILTNLRDAWGIVVNNSYKNEQVADDRAGYVEKKMAIRC